MGPCIIDGVAVVGIVELVRSQGTRAEAAVVVGVELLVRVISQRAQGVAARVYLPIVSASAQIVRKDLIEDLSNSVRLPSTRTRRGRTGIVHGATLLTSRVRWIVSIVRSTEERVQRVGDDSAKVSATRIGCRQA